MTSQTPMVCIVPSVKPFCNVAVALSTEIHINIEEISERVLLRQCGDVLSLLCRCHDAVENLLHVVVLVVSPVVRGRGHGEHALPVLPELRLLPGNHVDVADDAGPLLITNSVEVSLFWGLDR